MYILNATLHLDEQDPMKGEELARRLATLLPSPPVVVRKMRLVNRKARRFQLLWFLRENRLTTSYLEAIGKTPETAIEISVKKFGERLGQHLTAA